MDICGGNPFDCMAKANFGDWPCRMRGATCGENDTYVLSQLHFHWGDDSTKGSEHTICGSPRAAEMHMVFLNTRWGHPTDPVPWDLEDVNRGVRLLVLGVFINEGAENPHFENLLDSVQPPDFTDDFRERGLTHFANTSGPTRGPIILGDLLPDEYDSKFYSYPGSLTTPPCSQMVSWIVFENAIQWSSRQLEQLRSATTYYHMPHPHVHAYEALLFPLIMLIMGTMAKQFLSKFAPTVPYTMVVMLFGFFLQYLSALNNDGQLNPMQQSLRIWSNIDGHLLLYSFLPALLFGDVMKLNIHHFKQTIKQALLLAGPGVLLSTFLTGSVIHYILPYNWSYALSMAMGAILSATDPVAVVNLMKEVGAPPDLTMQITGESLLNDGTGVIVFMIFFDISRNRRGQYTPLRIIRTLARMIGLSPCLGFLIGTVAVFWMSKARHWHDHEDSLVQLSITLIAAYLSFFLSEHSKIGAASGILACVSAALVLAWRVWPLIASREAMETVWSTIEFIFNTLVFALVGVQIARAKVGQQAAIGWTELWYCFVLYAAVMIIRGIVVFVAYPFLNWLSPHPKYDVRPQEAFFIVWGGLRGAVALALGVLVKQQRSNSVKRWPNDDDDEAERILFLVGGVAFLTLIINAPTAGPLLKCLNIVPSKKNDPYKRSVLNKIKRCVAEAAEATYQNMCCKLNHDADAALDHISSLRHLKNTHKAHPAALRKLEATELVCNALETYAKRTTSYAFYKLKLERDVFLQLNPQWKKQLQDIPHTAPDSPDNNSSPNSVWCGGAFTIDEQQQNDLPAELPEEVATSPKNGGFLGRMLSRFDSGEAAVEGTPEERVVLSPLNSQRNPKGIATKTDDSLESRNGLAMAPVHGSMYTMSRSSKAVDRDEVSLNFNSNSGITMGSRTGDSLRSASPKFGNQDDKRHRVFATESGIGFAAADLAVRLEQCGEANKRRLPNKREMFMNMVRAEYWRMIDIRQLPQKAKLTISLLESIDVAMDDLDEPLSDYFKVLEPKLFPTGDVDEDDDEESQGASSGRAAAATSIEGLGSWLRQCTGCSTKLMEMDYERGFRNYETMYYVLRAIVVGHRRAQRNFARVLAGSGETIPYVPELLVVLLESAKQVAAAEARVQDISPILKSLVKTRIIADTVLNIQHMEIQRLIEDGALQETDAKLISDDVLRDTARIRSARHKQTKTIAKAAAEHERSSLRKSDELTAHRSWNRADTTFNLTDDSLTTSPVTTRGTRVTTATSATDLLSMDPSGPTDDNL